MIFLIDFPSGFLRRSALKWLLQCTAAEADGLVLPHHAESLLRK